MARSFIHKNLPELTKLFPSGGRRGKSGELPSDTVRRELVGLIRTLRRQREVPFYSMPDVARCFGVSVTTVARVFGKLQQEGLLRIRRGSSTVIPPIRPRPRARLDGVVAVPIWSPGFSRFQDWRLFYREFEEQVRRHGFVSDQIFYRAGEVTSAAFVERLLDHQPDIVLWLLPVRAHHQAILSLEDFGIRNVVIGTEVKEDAPKAGYRISWRTGLAKAFAAWKADGIRTVVVPGKFHRDSSTTRCVREVAQEFGLELKHTEPADFIFEDDLKSLARDDQTGVFFDEGLWLTMLCRTQGAELTALLRRARCLVATPLDLPFPMVTDIHVDALIAPWQEVAVTVARDIGEAEHRIEPRVFEAEFVAKREGLELVRHFLEE